MFDTIDEMKRLLNDRRCKPLSYYKPGRKIKAADKMQNYTYTLTARVGDIDFPLEVTPAQMLKRGVFEGKYCNDCMFELPREWYAGALRAGKLSPIADETLNEFGVKSRKSLKYWRDKGWIPITETHDIGTVAVKLGVDINKVPAADKTDHDVRGWFQWLCRYWLGRRQLIIDHIQIGRWRAFIRHRAQLRKHCGKSKLCRPVQRQALLQWGYEPTF